MDTGWPGCSLIFHGSPPSPGRGEYSPGPSSSRGPRSAPATRRRALAAGFSRQPPAFMEPGWRESDIGCSRWISSRAQGPFAHESWASTLSQIFHTLRAPGERPTRRARWPREAPLSAIERVASAQTPPGDALHPR